MRRIITKTDKHYDRYQYLCECGYTEFETIPKSDIQDFIGNG